VKLNRNRHSAQFKFEAGVDAAKGTRTINEPARQYDFIRRKSVTGSSNQYSQTGYQEAITAKRRKRQTCSSRLAVLQWNWNGLKKTPSAVGIKRMLIEPDHGQISIRWQCDLVSLSRSSFYYEPGNNRSY
jgi:putative transposase